MSFNFNSLQQRGYALIRLPDNSEGSLTVSLAESAATWNLVAGQGSRTQNTRAGSHVYTYNTMPDTLSVTYTLPTDDPVTGAFLVRMDFNVAVSGVSSCSFNQSADVLQGCDIGEPYGQNMVWTVPITPPASSSGFMTLILRADSLSYSGRTGPNANIPSRVINFDTSRPAIQQWLVPPAEQRNAFTVGLNWNQDVLQFDTADLSLIYSEGSTLLPSLVGGPRNWIITVPLPEDAQGTVRVRVASNSVLDASGLLGPLTQQESPAVTFNTKSEVLPYSPPSVTWSPPDGEVRALTFTVGVKWNQTVAGVEIGDFTTTGIDGANISGINPTIDTGLNYTLTITLPENRSGVLKVIARQNSVLPIVPPFDPGPVQDQSVDIPVDTRGSQPYVIFCGVPQDVVDAAFMMQLNWNVGVTGFASGDIQVHSDTGNTPAIVLTAGATSSTYNLTITPYNNEEGTITVTIGANSVTSDIGYVGPVIPQVSPTIQYDTRGPIPEAIVSAPDETIVDLAPITYAVQFNTPVVKVDGSALTKDVFRIEGVALSDASVSMSGSERNYTLTVMPPENTIGTINIYLDEGAVRSVVTGCGTMEGQLGPETPQSLASTDIWTGEKDSLNYPYVTFCAGVRDVVFSPTVGITASWSKTISGFDRDDILLTWNDENARAGEILADDFTGATPGDYYEFKVTFPKDSRGIVRVTIPKDAGRDIATDNYGPVIPASTEIAYNTIQEDKTPPTVFISRPFESVYQETVFEIVFSWSEPVVGFETSDIQLDSGVSGKSLSITTISADPFRQRFTALLTLPIVDSDTTATITVPRNSVVDEARPDANAGPTSDSSVSFVYNTALAGSSAFPANTTPICHEFYINSENPHLNEVLGIGGQRGGAFLGVSDLIKIGDYLYGVAQIQKKDPFVAGPITPVLTVVDDGDLTAASVTPSNTLADENFDTQITITLENANAPGPTATIVVTGTNDAGAVISESFSFTRATFGDPQTSEMFFRTVTSVAPSGFAAGTFDVTALGRGPRDNKVSRTIQAGAILFRANVVTCDFEVIKQYLYVVNAARSLVEYQGDLYFFEGSHYTYDSLNPAPGSVGHLRRYDTAEGTIHDIGINWRSKFGQDTGGFFDRRFGIHGATASPMLVDSKDSLHLISGYGNLNTLTSTANLDPNTRLNDRNAADVDNWQWITYGENIEYRVPIFDTNNTTGWEHLLNFARMTLSVIGFDENGAFFYKPKSPFKATVNENTGVHATELRYRDANLQFPKTGSLLIGNEIITYDGRTDEEFLNIQRAQQGTTYNVISTGAEIFYVHHIINTVASNTLINPVTDVQLRGDADQIYNQIRIQYGEDEFFHQDDDSVQLNGGQLFEMQLPLDVHQDTWVQWIAESFVENYKDLHYIINLQMNETFDIKRLHTVYLQVPERAHLNRLCQVYQIIYNQTRREIAVTLRTL